MFTCFFVKICFLKNLILTAERRIFLKKTKKTTNNEIKVAKLLTCGGQVIDPTACLCIYIYIYIIFLISLSYTHFPFLFFSCSRVVSLSLYLSICLSIYLPIYLFIYLSIYLSISLSIYLLTSVVCVFIVVKPGSGPLLAILMARLWPSDAQVLAQDDLSLCL